MARGRTALTAARAAASASGASPRTVTPQATATRATAAAPPPTPSASAGVKYRDSVPVSASGNALVFLKGDKEEVLRRREWHLFPAALDEKATTSWVGKSGYRPTEVLRAWKAANAVAPTPLQAPVRDATEKGKSGDAAGESKGAFETESRKAKFVVLDTPPRSIPLLPGTLVDVMTARGDFLATGFYEQTHAVDFDSEVPSTADAKAQGTGVHKAGASGASSASSGQAMSRAAVNVLSFSPLSNVGVDMWEARLRRALDYRARMGVRLGDADTTAFRLVNGEADGFPGCSIDFYAGTAVLHTQSIGMHLQKGAIVPALQRVLGASLTAVYDKGSFLYGVRGSKSDGELPPAAGYLLGSGNGTVEIRENGRRFLVDYARGQQLGFFLWHRDNRLLASQFAKGARVLDLFSYTGGFGVYAATAGANSIDAVDSSAASLRDYKRNLVLNLGKEHVTERKVAEVQAPPARINDAVSVRFLPHNAFVVLRDRLPQEIQTAPPDRTQSDGRPAPGGKPSARATKPAPPPPPPTPAREARPPEHAEQYDLAIVDQPLVNITSKSKTKAVEQVQAINTAVLRSMAPRSMVLSFVNTHVMDSDELVGCLFASAANAKRSVRLVRHLGPSADHATSLNTAHGEFVKGVLLELD